MKKLFVLCILGLAVLSFTSCGKEAKINVYTRDTTSGTRDGFFKGIGFNDARTDNSVLVSDVITRDGNGDVISSLKNDEYGVGYISLASLASSTLKGLTFEGVSPTEANVVNGTYKLTRNFNYIIRSEFATDAEKEIVEAFQAFLGTREAYETIVAKGGIMKDNPSDLPTWDSMKADYTIATEDNSNVTIRFGGSTSVESIAKALSSEFSALCGNFVPDHAHTGSGDAYKKTQGSEADGSDYLHIGFASREFKTEESAAAGTAGLICIDAIVAAVNSNNAIESITASTLKKMYDGTITKWSEVE